MDILQKLRAAGPGIARRDDMVLIHTEELDEVKCGVCEKNLIVNVYAVGSKLMRQIKCEKCNSEVWK